MNDRARPPNIYIVGAQCTGKTTLVTALYEYFNRREGPPEYNGKQIPRPAIITEVARTVLQAHSFTADDITSSKSRALRLQQLILQAQLSAERAATRNNNREGGARQGTWFISDRSAADPILYAQNHVGGDAAHDLLQSAEWIELKESMKRSLVVVCEAGADWLVDDGVRLMPKNRDEWIGFHNLFCACLDDWEIGYYVLLCNVTSIDQRVAYVLERWNGFISQ